MTTVGAVVPVHGWAPYLAEALDCVLAEAPDEVVVVDDGSPEPVRLHPDHAARVRVVRRDERGGPAAARNAGVAALSTELVAFCDADDAWEPGSLAPRVAAVAGDAAGAFGRARIVGPDGRETGERWPLPPAGRYADAAALYAANPILTSSVVLRRAAFGDGFRPRYSPAEDWDLWLRLLEAGTPLVCVPEAVVRYRRHPDALTQRVAVLAAAQTLVHADHGDRVPAVVRRAALRRDRRAVWRERLRNALGRG